MPTEDQFEARLYKTLESDRVVKGNFAYLLESRNTRNLANFLGVDEDDVRRWKKVGGLVVCGEPKEKVSCNAGHPVHNSNLSIIARQTMSGNKTFENKRGLAVFGAGGGRGYGSRPETIFISELGRGGFKMVKGNKSTNGGEGSVRDYPLFFHTQHFVFVKKGFGLS